MHVMKHMYSFMVEWQSAYMEYNIMPIPLYTPMNSEHFMGGINLDFWWGTNTTSQ